MNNNNININKTEYTEINIDKRILPLFSTPVILKKISDQRRNKYNFNILNPQKQLTYKIISLNQILELFLKGISLYNYNLKNYLLKRNKLNLILDLKRDENYKLNIRLSNFIYCVKKIISIFKIKSLLNSVKLFSPKHLFKPEPNIRFNYRLRYITKNFILSNNKRNNKINRRQINKLISQGNDIINELDSQITKKQNILKNIKTNKLLSIINSFFPNTYNTKLNNLENSNKSVNSTLFPSVSTTPSSLNNLKKINDQKLTINKIFKSINKSNEVKIEQTMNSILKNKNFDCNTDSISINSNPVSLLYYNNNNINSNTIQLETKSANLSDQSNLNKKPILSQYLKSMSNYNMKSNGIFIFYSNIIGYNFNSETNKLIKNIYNLLAASFKSMYCLISKPVFVITPDKIIIQLFYYLFIPNILKLKQNYKKDNRRRNKLSFANWKKRRNDIKKLYSKFRKMKIKVRVKLRKLSNLTLTKVFPEKFKKLCEILSHLFKKPVELDLIRLHYPYNDSNILVNLLGIMINKIKLRIIIRRLFEKAVVKNLRKITTKNKVNIIPAFLSGMTIRVAGRLLTQRVIPRQTVKTTRRGASAKGKINFSDVARYTNKNKRGAFSITVSSGQNFFN